MMNPLMNSRTLPRLLGWLVVELAVTLVALPVVAQSLANPGITGLGFGGTLSVSGNYAVVGSAPTGWPRGDEPAGAVYVFGRDADGNWSDVARLMADDARTGDDFGRTVFMHDGMIVVGAPGNGAAYVFEMQEDAQWAQTGKLIPKELAEGAEFGGAYARAGSRTGNIAMAGDQIVVTSYNGDTHSGAAHVFRVGENGWEESSVLQAATAKEGDGFGFSVAADAGNIFVSAPRSNEQAGLVYVFMDHGYWMQMGRLVPPGEGAAQLGSSLSVADGKVYAGAPATNRVGTVEVYAVQPNGMFGHDSTIAPMLEEGESLFAFGRGVAVSGTTAMITAGGAAFATDLSTGNMTRIDAHERRIAPGFGTGVAWDGSTALIGSPGADYEAGLATVWASSDEDWSHVATLESDVIRLPSYSGDKVECEEGEARGFACENVDLVSFMSIADVSTDRGVGMTDIWGWEDPETGKEWVILGRTEGVSFVDISTPSNPVWVGELPKTVTSPGSGWRDVKVYKDHAFVVADGAEQHGLQIFDLRQLRDVDPADMPVTFDETARYDGTASTHNVVINEETGFAYLVGNRSGGETCGGQLHMVDIRDPQNPTFAGCQSLEEAGGTHDSQCVIYRGEDVDYQGREICFNSSGNMFVIADVTDKENPVTLAATSYPNQAYTHQGWLTEDHDYFYMNDELDEMGGLTEQTRTLIWDVRDLEDPTLAKEFFLSNPASDHNLYIRDNFMYQSNYQAGLRILDISDPENPVEVGHFDTVPFGEDEAGFGGSWSNYPYFKSGVIAVSSRGEGLFLLRKRELDL
ncbi:MAG: choice-of-anchor B family protein [Bacteroidota bacterium]|nr:choice-of-anchor B family protein [Bacteroidota bacterium]